MTEQPAKHLSRRGIFGVAATGAAGVAVLGHAVAAPAVAAPKLPDGACMVTPQSIEGPYYVDDNLIRSDIREGRAGVPVRLTLQVIGADCHPFAGARVDTWQADPKGVYSGFTGQGDTDDVDTKGQSYLRGTQFTDAAGQVRFDTIYPGWYRGRTPHIHAKVWLDRATVANVQLYFPDALNEFIFTQVPAYHRAVQRDTINATDLFVRPTGSSGFVEVAEKPDHYAVSLVVAVDPDARPMPFGRPGFHPAHMSGAPPGMIGPRPQHDAAGRIMATKALPPEERMRKLVPGA